MKENKQHIVFISSGLSRHVVQTANELWEQGYRPLGPIDVCIAKENYGAIYSLTMVLKE